MTDACKDHYFQLHATTASVLSASFDGDNATHMATSHAFATDYALWVNAVAQRPERAVFESALREYRYALLSLSFGHYRAAFSALRLTLELTLAGIQWSTNERELREWKSGQRDTNWNVLTDKDSGILSKSFVKLFGEVFADDTSWYLASAISVYRECSEYVHGNAKTQFESLNTLGFSQDLFNMWHQKASTVRIAISFSLAARYLTDFSTETRNHLESMLMQNLGHLQGVRILLGAPVEASNV